MALVSIRAGHFNLTLQVDYALVGEIPTMPDAGMINARGNILIH
jgi:hypothetical protein